MLLSWAAVEILVFLPLFLAGFLVFPIAEEWADIVIVKSRVWDRYIVSFKRRWVNAWLGNDEDGLAGVVNGEPIDPYLWFIRNPVSNMRFWPWISIRPRAVVKDVDGTPISWVLPSPLSVLGNVSEIVETPGWFVCRCGWYVGARWIWKKPILTIKGLWLGWKLNPRDARPGAPGIPANDYRKAGIGLACQILRS
jgi:hypothetical protein